MLGQPLDLSRPQNTEQQGIGQGGIHWSNLKRLHESYL